MATNLNHLASGELVFKMAIFLHLIDLFTVLQVLQFRT